MKPPSTLRKKIPAAPRAFLLPAAFCATLATASAQQTYTWTQGAGTLNANQTWSLSNNWSGSPTLTFNSTTDLIFDNDSVVNRANALAIGGNRTIRSITINADYASSNNNTFDIQTYATINTTARTLTFAADSGNASINVAQSTSGTVQVRIGNNAGGNVILNSNLDIAQNNTFFNASGLLFDGVVSGAGAINKTGAGVVSFNRNNANWGGGMNINDGTVTVVSNPGAMGTGAWTLGGGANNTTFLLGSTQVFSNSSGLVVAAGAGTRTIANVGLIPASGIGNPTFSGNITLNKDATVAITQYTATTHDRMTLSGNVTGTGGIVKTNNGILILSGTNNNYSGTTDIQGGKFYLGGAGRLGSGNVTIASGANLDFGTGASQINNVANNISGAGEIFQNVASTDTRITGDVTNTGGLTINAGTFRIGNGTTTGSYSGDTVINGGTLAFSRSNNYTHGGTISGAGSVSKVDAGVVTITGNNSYSGLTSLFAGALVADHANALGTGNITFSNLSGNTGTLRYTANSSATDWATRIVNSTGTIRLDTNGNDVTLAGAINTTNTNGLIKSGAGTLTLGGNNTYTGGTTLSTGTLLVTNSGGSGTGSGDVIVNAGILGGNGTISGNVALNGATIGSASNVLTLSSNLTTTGNSNVAATSTVNVAGTTTVSSGNFTLNGTLGGSGNVIVSSGAALVGNATINNATSLSGGTLGTSGNTLNLLSTLAASGNNTIATDVRVNVAGTTTISSGTFSVNGTLGDTGAKNVLSGATLAGSGTVEGPVAIFGTVAPGNSPGTLTQGATSFEAGGDYNWQVLDATGVAGTGFDTINLLSGNVLTINATSVTKFDINLWSLLSIAPDVNGVASNFIDTNSYSWTLVATDQPIVAFAADKFGIFTAANNGTDGFANSFTGTFGVALSGDNTDLMLTYTPIPEPSGYAALAGVGMIGFALYRRRRVAGQKAA